MSKNYFNLLLKPLVFCCLVAAMCSVAVGQGRPVGSISIGADQGSNDDPRLYTSMEEERRAKREIEDAEKAHKQNLERAKDLAFLGSSLFTSFKEKNHLDKDDIKKLQKAEKLAKGILDAAGGSNEQVEPTKQPTDLASAMCRFSELTESLKLKVEKTPKRVISTAVIDEANVLLELIRVVRAMHPKTQS